jgi:hypothetical protein
MRCAHGQVGVFGDGLGAGTDVKLFVNAADVGVDGLDADLEHLGDFLVEIATGEEFEDFAFARGEFDGLALALGFVPAK